MFQRVSVWFDAATPDRVALTYARDWAARLGLPLNGVLLPVAGDTRLNPPMMEFMTGCQRQGVSWTTFDEDRNDPMQHLVVIGHSLRNSAGDDRPWCGEPALLTCPPTWTAVQRVLVLNPAQRSADEFLTSAAQVCRALQVVPVVLTLAATDGDARRREDAAHDILKCHGLSPTLDRVTGCDPTTAAAVAARLRRCSTVVTAGDDGPARRWPWRKKRLRPAALADAVAVLTLANRDAVTPHSESTDRSHAAGRSTAEVHS